MSAEDYGPGLDRFVQSLSPRLSLTHMRPCFKRPNAFSFFEVRTTVCVSLVKKTTLFIKIITKIGFETKILLFIVPPR